MNTNFAYNMRKEVVIMVGSAPGNHRTATYDGEHQKHPPTLPPHPAGA
ncbi:hypothetical protein [Streptomyces virginiae]